MLNVPKKDSGQLTIIMINFSFTMNKMKLSQVNNLSLHEHL